MFNKPTLPFIVEIAETWLYDNIPDACLNLPDYTVLRYDRPSKGGGVLLLVHKNYSIANVTTHLFGNIQVLSCDIENFFCNCPIARFSCVYRPPNSQLQYSLSFLKALETKIAPLKANFPVIVMGDFNLTKIDWVTHRPTLNHTTADAQLILTSQRIHLIQKVLSPSRHNNITDLLFVSDNNLLTNVSVGMPFSTSDHNTIYFDLLTLTPLHLSATPSFVTNLHQRLDFTKIDYNGFSSALLTTD